MPLIDEVIESLFWSGSVSGFRLKIDKSHLASYLTTDWLTDEHESLMLEVLQRNIATLAIPGHIEIHDVWFYPLLENAHADLMEDYASGKSYRWLREVGNKAASHGSRVVTITNVDDNHWIVIVVDFGAQKIRVGDSMGGMMSKEMRDVFDWWTTFHSNQKFGLTNLPITVQQDSHSCGMLAWNALAHFLLPSQYPLINPLHVTDERLKMFLRLTEPTKVGTLSIWVAMASLIK
ncbi:hypothetical protein BD779DRAFT_1448283 [Infundibulicybe gibba]|nr:hypothetical protein BD779DRAFT_1448283 [Infundibulicybe gibba]